jgi:hypothetical protein
MHSKANLTPLFAGGVQIGFHSRANSFKPAAITSGVIRQPVTYDHGGEPVKLLHDADAQFFRGLKVAIISSWLSAPLRVAITPDVIGQQTL